MSTDQDPRVRAAVRDLADAVPVVAPPPGLIRLRARRPTTRAGARWLAPAFAAAAVAAIVTTVAIVPGWFWAGTTPSDPAASAAGPALPERFASPSWRTASLAASPPGPAIAVFAQGEDKLVVVGADGRSYRRLDRGLLSELSYGRGHAVGDPVLSPDGTRLAGSDGYAIDLTTGQGQWFPIVNGDGVDRWTGARLLAWSPDGRLLAYQVPEGISLLNLESGQARPLEVELFSTPAGLAFSSDGREIAVSIGETAEPDAPAKVVVFDLSGSRLRELDLPRPLRLAGNGVAWSPDGALLVVEDNLGRSGVRGLRFVDATGTDAPVPGLIEWDSPVELLGWRSPHTMLVRLDGDSGSASIIEVHVDGSRRVASRLPDEVSSLHLATGLLAHAEVRDTGRPTHGPLPAPYRAAIGIAAAALAVLAVGGAWRTHRRMTSR